LTDDDRMRGQIIEHIMCDFGAEVGRICPRYYRTPDGVVRSSSLLKDPIAAGVVTISVAKLQMADDAIPRAYRGGDSR